MLDALDDLGQLLQRLALVVVQLLFQLRDTLNLVFNGGVTSNALLFLKVAEELVNVTSTALENVAGALENLNLSFEFFQRLLSLFVLLVLLSQVGRVLPEIVPLQVLASLELLVLILTLLELSLELDFLGFEALLLIHLLLLFLLDCLRLATIDG